jgi:hypothetical protein
MHWGGSMKSVKAPSGKYGATGRTYCNKIEPIETFVEYESATNFKGFEALIDDRFVFKRKLDECMMNCDDRLRRFSEMLTN